MAKKIIIKLNVNEPTASAVGAADWVSPIGVSVLELLSRPSLGRIVTFCKPLDDLLGGGIACGQITEFCKSSAWPALLVCLS
jgi:RecA/RadA recombinase